MSDKTLRVTPLIRCIRRYAVMRFQLTVHSETSGERRITIKYMMTPKFGETQPTYVLKKPPKKL